MTKLKHNWLLISGILAIFFFLTNMCKKEDSTEEQELNKHSLTLIAEPQDYGFAEGAGEYLAGDTIIISAQNNEGYIFAYWAGDEGPISNEQEFEFVMPGEDVELTAQFILENQTQYGSGVTDIDGNFYKTVIIGNLEWMADNLRTTRYQDGSAITSDLTTEEWRSTYEGAYTFYPHDGGIWADVEGISSDAEMKAAYGLLYNAYAVIDERNICPIGWRVSTDDDWNNLENFLINEYDLSNNFYDVVGLGSILKSCRQVNSPFGEECQTIEHPRWNFTSNEFGSDRFGLNILPSGVRADSLFGNIGLDVGIWTPGEDYFPDPCDEDCEICGGEGCEQHCEEGCTYNRRFHKTASHFNRHYSYKRNGYAVRCTKDVGD